MKNGKFVCILLIIIFALSSCGPILVTSRPNHPPPPWFYPNRLEVVRYVYFPEYDIYYDLSMSDYLYFNNGVWVRAQALPHQYQNIDLNRSRYTRVKGYRSDNIRDYHNEHNSNRGRSNTSSSSSGRGN